MPEALENANAAMAKAYGPRKLRIYDTMVSIHQKTGDTAAARKTLEEELAFAQSLPDGQRSDASIARIKKQLEATP
jgi:hypothetical protein